MTPELEKFLTDYIAWIDNGAPNYMPFSRHDGLCYNAERVNYDTFRAVKTMLKEEFGERSVYPFGGMLKYWDDTDYQTQHLNEQRNEWVRNKLEQKETT